MLIHIGYQKASSTFLQQRLFLPEHGYWPLFREKIERQQFNRHIVDPPAFHFDPAAFALAIAKQLEKSPDRALAPVISAESLVGIPQDAGMGTTKYIADRIIEHVPDARILVIIREQTSMILSHYFQYVRGGGTRTLEEFAHPPGSPLSDNSRWVGMFPAFLEYDRLVGYYRERLGSDRVLAFPFELLGRNAREYVERIGEFAGVRTDASRVDLSVVKEGVPANIIGPRRFANAVLSRELDNPFSRVMPARVYWRGARYALRMIDASGRKFDASSSKSRFRTRVDRVFDNYYRESNRRLASMTGLDLEALGYRT